MGTYTVTIGWTLNDKDDRDYVSYADGYRKGAPQHTEVVEVEWVNPPANPRRVAEGIADAVFAATNHPFPTCLQGVARQLVDKIDATGWTGHMRGRLVGHYSLSVGDTVTVGDVTVACADEGWDLVT